MKWLVLAPVVATGAYYYTAHDAVGRTWPVPYAEARELLADARLPELIFGEQQVRQSVDTNDPDQILFYIGQGGAEVMHYVITTEATEPGKTRVTVTLEGAKEGRFAGAEGRMANEPTLRKLYTVAMEEAVAAQLEKRDYQMTAIYPAMMAATMKQMPQMMKNLDEVAARDRQRDRAAP